MSIKFFLAVSIFEFAFVYGQHTSFPHSPGKQQDQLHQKGEQSIRMLSRDSINRQMNHGMKCVLSQQIFSIIRLHKAAGDADEVYVPDTVEVYSTVDTSKYIISYNSKGLFIRGMYKTLMNGQWSETERQSVTYDAYGKIISELDERWSGGQWAATERYTYVRDAVGQTISELNEQWSDGQLWQYRYTYSYGANGKVQSEVDEQWLNGQVWTNNRKYSYAYNAEGSVLSESMEQWLHGKWTNGEQNLYTYDLSGNNISKLVQVWSNDQWNNYMYYSYNYNSQGKILSELWSYWSNDRWNNYLQYNYSYDVKGLLEAESIRYNRNGQWENNSQYLYAYDAFGNRLSEMMEYWSNGQWTNSNLSSYQYDSFHHILSESFYAWSGYSWQPVDVSDAVDAGGYQYPVKCCRLNLLYARIDTTVNSTAVTPFSISQNYPNPFNSTTTIMFHLPQKGFVSLKVFDIRGREIISLVQEELEGGSYIRQWNAASMASGIYFYRLVVNPSNTGQSKLYTETKKILLLR
jgi:hypothetical protein